MGTQDTQIHKRDPHMLRKRTFAAVALLVAASFGTLPAAAQEEARYRVTFEAGWSAASHPEGFPGNPHFSGLVWRNP